MNQAAQLVAAALYLRARRKLFFYRPYGHPDTLKGPWSHKPWQTRYHAAGVDHPERMMMAANRVGKTEMAAAEVAFHLTGEYPAWWTGKRFDGPVLVWTGSPTNETSRDIVQKALLGGSDKENLGTGYVPGEYLVGRPRIRQAGVSDVVDTFKVKHTSGGVSTCTMKTYEQGWRKWQGTAPSVVWMDEEPDDNEVQGRIYSEALTRLLTTQGLMLVTFTPLLGQTPLVRHYQHPESQGIYLDTATWEDAPHLDRDARDRLAASYPDHEVQARTQGVPMMGEGRLFLTPEDEIRCPSLEIPSHWARIKGIDFGIDHPAAVVDLAWDRDRDVVYVTRVWREKGATTETHAAAITHDTPWVPVSWPHDGTNREKANGQRLKDVYGSHGVRMLSMSARYKNEIGGRQAVEPIIVEVQERCRTGGLKVFSHCHAWFDEYRNAHRKDGRIVTVRDDALKATYYGLMMRRYAAINYIFAPRQRSSRPLVSMR